MEQLQKTALRVEEGELRKTAWKGEEGEYRD